MGSSDFEGGNSPLDSSTPNFRGEKSALIALVSKSIHFQFEFGQVRFVRFQALSPVNPIDFIKSVWQKLKMQLILLFSLFLLLFMDPTVLFGTIHDSHCTFQLIFTFIYSIFNKKFSVSAK